MIFIILFIPIVFLAIGLVFIMLQNKLDKSQESCTSETTGTVIEIKESKTRAYKGYDTATEIYSVYYPICKFTTPDGLEHQATSAVGSGKTVNIGDTKLIRYDPKNPDVAHIVEDRIIKKIGIWFIVSSLIYLACCMVFLVIYLL